MTLGAGRDADGEVYRSNARAVNRAARPSIEAAYAGRMPIRRIVGILASVALFAVPFLLVVFIVSRIFGFELQGNIGVWVAWLLYLIVVAWIVRRWTARAGSRE